MALPTRMRAVGVARPSKPGAEARIVDYTTRAPSARGRDLLVAVQAVAANSIDLELREASWSEDGPRVLGLDVAGEVVAVGADATLFEPGDRVFYAGDATRSGGASTFHLVDERLVGAMPTRTTFAEAAALPLASLMAWQALFGRLHISTPPRNRPRRTLLVVGGTCGTGSMAIQLAAKVAGLDVIATASQPETVAWCREMGAAHVVEHDADLLDQVEKLGLDHVDLVLVARDLERHLPAVSRLVAPSGMICSLAGHAGPLDLSELQAKGAGLVWQANRMSPYQAASDPLEQHYILGEVARLIDHGILKSPVARVLSPICAATLTQAHAQLRAGRMIGRIVVEGAPVSDDA